MENLRCSGASLAPWGHYAYFELRSWFSHLAEVALQKLQRDAADHYQWSGIASHSHCSYSWSWSCCCCCLWLTQCQAELCSEMHHPPYGGSSSATHFPAILRSGIIDYWPRWLITLLLGTSEIYWRDAESAEEEQLPGMIKNAFV